MNYNSIYNNRPRAHPLKPKRHVCDGEAPFAMHRASPSSEPHEGFHFQMQPDIEVVDNGMPERPRKVVVLASWFWHCSSVCRNASRPPVGPWACLGAWLHKCSDRPQRLRRVWPSSRPQWSKTTKAQARHLPCGGGARGANATSLQNGHLFFPWIWDPNDPFVWIGFRPSILL